MAFLCSSHANSMSSQGEHWFRGFLVQLGSKTAFKVEIVIEMLYKKLCMFFQLSVESRLK